jgi:taurine dioxygenase
MTTTPLGTKLAIRKITARVGAEVTGLGPDLTLDPETIAAVRAALNEHKALVFRWHTDVTFVLNPPQA